jgi:hypothetical protein
MAGDRLLDGPKASERGEAVGPARGPRDLRAQAEGLLREVAYVLHLTRRVRAAMTRPGAGAAGQGGDDRPGA